MHAAGRLGGWLLSDVWWAGCASVVAGGPRRVGLTATHISVHRALYIVHTSRLASAPTDGAKPSASCHARVEAVTGATKLRMWVVFNTNNTGWHAFPSAPYGGVHIHKLANCCAGIICCVVLRSTALQVQPTVLQALAVTEAHTAVCGVAERLARAGVAGEPKLAVQQLVAGLVRIVQHVRSHAVARGRHRCWWSWWTWWRSRRRGGWRRRRRRRRGWPR
jgi:hypothetical protein